MSEANLKKAGRVLKGCLMAFVAGGSILLLSGCAGTDEDKISSRPWNAPNGWESGLPGGIQERR